MKTVLISIQPKWCDLIVSGKKTVEVRKTVRMSVARVVLRFTVFN